MSPSLLKFSIPRVERLIDVELEEFVEEEGWEVEALGSSF